MKLRESIKMLFGVVSVVGQGIGVLDGVHVPQGNSYFTKKSCLAATLTRG